MADRRQKDVYCWMHQCLAGMYDELSEGIAVVAKRHLGAQGVVLRQMRTTAKNNAVDCREAADVWEVFGSGGQYSDSYLSNMERQFEDMCREIPNLSCTRTSGEVMVFCQKMKADYYWYVAENAPNTQWDAKKEAAEEAKGTYVQLRMLRCP